MTTVLIPERNIRAVIELLKVNGVRHEPFRKTPEGYKIELVTDHPIASFLQLRYT